MAKKIIEQKKILERVYIIPLRKEYQKSPKYRRAKKAVNAVKKFISRHMKSDDVLIGRQLNLKLWEQGIKNPPYKVKVNTVKYDDNRVIVELFGKPIEDAVEETKDKKEAKEEKPKKEHKAESKDKKKEEAHKEVAELEEKLGESKEEKLEHAKEIEKEEITELKKEHPKTHTPHEPLKQKDMHLKKKEMIPGR